MSFSTNQWNEEYHINKARIIIGYISDELEGFKTHTLFLHEFHP